jgi:hypothetical protein
VSILKLFTSKAGEIFLRLVSSLALYLKGRSDAKKKYRLKTAEERNREARKAAKYRRTIERNSDDAINKWLQQDDDSWY